MKNLLTLFLSLFISLSTFATHIIGGDFQVTQTGANTFFVTLTVFRDCNPGNSTSVSISGCEVRDNVTNALVTSLSSWTGPVTNNPPIGDLCFDPTQFGICVEKRIFTKTVTLSDNPNGYYIAWDICCRNGTVANLDVGPPSSPSAGSTFYVQIPDPALWNGTSGNSTPDFGDYPVDGYFCLSADSADADIKDFSVTDADGDDLKYYLINPYDDGTTSKPFNLVGWQAGHSLTNLLGNFSVGYQPMTIDVNTGYITCFPETQGLYAFAVLVEEWRNGVKIGETVRDIQYQTLSCTSANIPLIDVEDSIVVYVEDSICFDLMVTSTSSDSVYLHITSSNFDLQGNFVPPTIGTSTSSYPNWMNTGVTETFNNLGLNTNMIGPGTAIAGVGEIPLRYCWLPPCEAIDSTFYIDMVAVIEDTCGNGSDTVTLGGDLISVLINQTDLAIHVINTPPPVLIVPDDTLLQFGESICIDLEASDAININDTIYLQPYSSNFDFGTAYVPPVSIGGGAYFYDDWKGVTGDSVIMNNYVFSGLTPGAIGNVALRFCWTADCDYVYVKDIYLNYMAYSSACNPDTIYDSTHYQIDPPVTLGAQVPNVFSPNGDGENDVYKLYGDSDPCYDFMTVTIYNRWGQKVFESNDPVFEWDGTRNGKGDCKAGTYYVLIDGSFGSSYDPNTGERIPFLVKDEYWIQLLR